MDEHKTRPTTPVACARHRACVLRVMSAQKKAQGGDSDVRRMTFEELWEKDVGELARLYQESRRIIDATRLMSEFGVLQ